MSNKPVSADDLLEDVASAWCDTECDHPRCLDNKQSAKRHLAEAVKAIIGEDDTNEYGDLGTGTIYYKQGRNDLRAEQRKRLAEWLGGSI